MAPSQRPREVYNVYGTTRALRCDHQAVLAEGGF
jgi:hypothetical protein